MEEKEVTHFILKKISEQRKKLSPWTESRAIEVLDRIRNNIYDKFIRGKRGRSELECGVLNVRKN